MERYSEEAKLLGKYEIHTAGQLLSEIKEMEQDCHSIAKKRAKLRNRLKHLHDTAIMQPIREEISELSRQMAQIRREISLCEDIAARSGVVENAVEAFLSEREKEKNER